MKTTLLLKYFLWSMLVFALSVGLMSFRALRSLELRSFDIAVGLRIRWQSRPSEKVETPVAPLPIWGYSSNEAYLRNVRQVVRSLKNAGAKVVVVPLPDNLVSVPRILGLLNAINSDSIAVFGSEMRIRSPFPTRTSFTFEERRTWWVRQPAFHRIEIPWGVSSVLTDPYSLLYRFVPDAFKDFETGERVPDIALQAIKRYLGYPDSLEIRISPSYVFFGTYTIPLERDGFAYVRYSPLPVYGGGVYATVVPEADSLVYFPAAWSGRLREKNLDNAWQFYKNKIVILDWSGLSQAPFVSYDRTYAQIIHAILSRSYVKRYNDYDLLFILLFVSLLSVLSYKLRGLVTLGITFLLSLGILALSIWLFDRYSILFDPVYVLVPIVLCGVILPVVKLTEEKRVAEELIRSLEDEKKRLEDLVRNLPPRL